MNKRIFTVLAMSAVLFANGPVQAGHGDGDGLYDYAKVVQVDPVIRHVRVSEPRQECWDEEVPVYEARHRSATPMILGGIIGGAVGNTMGKGHGKDAATIAGVILGGSIGRDIGEQNHRPARQGTVLETQCRQVTDYREEERIEGYDVTYRYRGEEYVTRMPHDPGERLRVRVSVTPVW